MNIKSGLLRLGWKLRGLPLLRDERKSSSEKFVEKISRRFGRILAYWSKLGSPLGGKKVAWTSFAWDDRAWLVELSLKIKNLDI